MNALQIKYTGTYFPDLTGTVVPLPDLAARLSTTRQALRDTLARNKVLEQRTASDENLTIYMHPKIRGAQKLSAMRWG